nr:hypothetical protein Itr_chr13CG16470 [Ipomoea trifida]
MTYHPRRGREERKTNPGNKSHVGSRIPPWAPAPPSGKTPNLVPFPPLRAPPNDILAYVEECHMDGQKGHTGKWRNTPDTAKRERKG